MDSSKSLIELIDEYMAMDLDDAELAIPRMNLRRAIDDCHRACYAMGDVQPCGHPAQAVVPSDEGTNYCGWCADVARYREALETAERQGIHYVGTDEYCHCGHVYGAEHDPACPFAVLNQATE